MLAPRALQGKSELAVMVTAKFGRIVAAATMLTSRLGRVGAAMLTNRHSSPALQGCSHNANS